MDGGSGLNILYIDTLDAMRIPRLELRLTGSPFHGVIPGAQAYPLGQIDLPITFGSWANFCLEVLTFEVVDFLGSYHAILGQPCYARFMAIPNYTYLKLKMPKPNNVITVSSAFSHAFECDREHYELATTVVNSSKLPQLRESSTPAVPDCNKPTSSTAFRPLKETKAVGVDPTDLAKMPFDMPRIPWEVTEHALCLILGSKPAKQSLCHFDDERCRAIGEEIVKLLAVGFIREVFHSDWLANPVLVKKKTRKWRMCIDYTGLNKALMDFVAEWMEVQLPTPNITHEYWTMYFDGP
ncbi:uncharacterized protein [Miscanthus floridulus]|uniref:uncharacterized protein n=1 Tax=Miscanthus floridulus TaxID=154761 RepID=UPI0034581FF9